MSPFHCFGNGRGPSFMDVLRAVTLYPLQNFWTSGPKLNWESDFCFDYKLEVVYEYFY